jgi:hypothetical protein
MSLDALKKDLAPVQPIAPAWATAILTAAVCLLLTAAGVRLLGFNPPPSFTPFTYASLSVAFLLAVGGCSYAAAQWMSPSGRANFWRPIAGIALALWAVFLVGRAGSFDWASASLCLTVGSTASLAASLTLLWLHRRAAPIMRHRIAVVCGILSGFIGFLTIQLHCPIDELWHIMSGHAILPVVWGLIGYLLAKGVLSARTS